MIPGNIHAAIRKAVQKRMETLWADLDYLKSIGAGGPFEEAELAELEVACKWLDDQLLKRLEEQDE